MVGFLLTCFFSGLLHFSQIFHWRIDYIQIRFSIFAMFFSITCSMSGMSNEKGIRFKSGAVPAAVSLNANFLNYKSLFVNRRMGRHQKEGEPEYLLRITTLFFAFRGK